MDTGVIAAASALAGVALSGVLQILKDRFERRAKGASTRLQKLEELADSMYQARESLLAAALDFHPAGQQQPESLAAALASANRVRSLSLLYFPQLRPQAEVFQKAAAEFSFAIQDRNSDKLRTASQAMGHAFGALESGIADCAAAMLD
jgi:hypothetical protein